MGNPTPFFRLVPSLEIRNGTMFVHVIKMPVCQIGTEVALGRTDPRHDPRKFWPAIAFEETDHD